MVRAKQDRTATSSGLVHKFRGQFNPVLIKPCGWFVEHKKAPSAVDQTREDGGQQANTAALTDREFHHAVGHAVAQSNTRQQCLKRSVIKQAATEGGSDLEVMAHGLVPKVPVGLQQQPERRGCPSSASAFPVPYQ